MSSQGECKLDMSRILGKDRISNIGIINQRVREVQRKVPGQVRVITQEVEDQKETKPSLLVILTNTDLFIIKFYFLNQLMFS
jgi:hypothetical protein